MAIGDRYHIRIKTILRMFLCVGQIGSLVFLLQRAQII